MIERRASDLSSRAVSEGVSSKELARDSVAFVLANTRAIKEYLKPLLPVLLAGVFLCEIARTFSPSPIMGHGALIAASVLGVLLLAYGHACFLLAWHRTVLKKPGKACIVQPFALKRDDVQFMKALFVVLFLPVVLALVVGLLGGFLVAFISLMASIVVQILSFIVMGIAYFRLSFILPARAIGAPLKIKEAMELAEGWCWKFFVTVFRAGIVISLLFALYSYAIMFILHFFEGSAEGSVVGLIASFVLYGLPNLAYNIFMIALGVTILSRLYQMAAARAGRGATLLESAAS